MPRPNPQLLHRFLPPPRKPGHCLLGFVMFLIAFLLAIWLVEAGMYVLWELAKTVLHLSQTWLTGVDPWLLRA